MFLKGWCYGLAKWFKAQHYGRNATDSRYVTLEAVGIGFVAAIAALVIKEGINVVGSWRLQWAHSYGALWVLPLTGIVLGSGAGFLIEQFSLAAAGGGIPPVKAALARYPIPLTWPVAVVKTLGTILILGGGLPLGRRAPTVHIGAALASELSRLFPTSPEHRRQMIAAGAAAGLAAGFITPIAGVLFVVEELMRDVSSLTLETAIVASFVGAVTSLLLQSSDLNFSHHLSESLTTYFSVPEIPFYLLLGVLAGILGAILNRGILQLQQWQRGWNLSLSVRIGGAGLICGVAIALLPAFFRDNAGLKDVVLTGALPWYQTLLMLAAHFVLTMVAFSTEAPGGLFAPALVMGGALGYLVGGLEGYWLTNPDAATTFALAGMGAFFTSVVRVPVTAIVIVFELTGKFNVVLPLMISCAVAYLVAETLFPRSLYEHLLQTKGIDLKEEPPQGDFLSQLTAAQVMQSQVESLASDLTLEQVLPIMSQSHHRGFPVLEQERLVGIFTQTDLANAHQRPRQTPLRELMTPNPITVFPEARLSDVLYLLNRYQLSRLPVIDNQRLVGIITRTDIIREEVSQLGNQSHNPHPAYVVYQTRSPSVGKKRLLLPLSNSRTATALFQIAAALAQQQNYEIDCLQVVKVPKHCQPRECIAPTQKSRQLLQRLERLARRLGIAIHTQIQLSHHVANTILDTIRNEQIELLILEWSGQGGENHLFNRTVDILIDQAPCDLLLVKLGQGVEAYPKGLYQSATWLMPMAGGPNMEKAVSLLPALLSLYPSLHPPQVLLTKVYLHDASGPEPSFADLKTKAAELTRQLGYALSPLPLCATSVPEALLSVLEAQPCNAIFLGASREGLLPTLLHGNIPHLIATQTETTVLVFRSST